MNRITRKSCLFAIIFASLFVTHALGAAIDPPRRPHNVKPFHNGNLELQRRANEPFFEIDVKSLNTNSPISELCKKICTSLNRLMIFFIYKTNVNSSWGH